MKFFKSNIFKINIFLLLILYYTPNLFAQCPCLTVVTITSGDGETELFDIPCSDENYFEESSIELGANSEINVEYCRRTGQCDPFSYPWDSCGDEDENGNYSNTHSIDSTFENTIICSDGSGTETTKSHKIVIDSNYLVFHHHQNLIFFRQISTLKKFHRIDYNLKFAYEINRKKYQYDNLPSGVSSQTVDESSKIVIPDSPITSYKLAADGRIGPQIFFPLPGNVAVRDPNNMLVDGDIRIRTTGSLAGSIVFRKLPEEVFGDGMIYFDFFDKDNNLEHTIEFKVIPTPVVLINGINSSIFVWSELTKKLKSNNWTDDIIHKVLYDNDNSFVFAALDMDFQVKAFIDKLKRDENLFFTRYDIVAHSMGGLVARQYAHNYDTERRIRKIITLNTPHYGSEIANCIVEPGTNLGNLCQSVANNIVFPETFDITDGAIADLATNSKALSDLSDLNTATWVKYHAMTSDFSGCTIVNSIAINAVMIGVSIIIKNLTPFVFHKFLESGCDFHESLLPYPNDGVVSVHSQSGGLSSLQRSQYQGVVGTLHTKTTKNDNILNKMALLLNSRSDSHFFSNAINIDPKLNIESFRHPSIYQNSTLEISTDIVSDTIVSCSDLSYTIHAGDSTEFIIVLYHLPALDTMIIDTIFGNSAVAEFPILVDSFNRINLHISATDGNGGLEYYGKNIFIDYNATFTDELIYNGIDDDCNAMTLDDDLDQDGYLLADDCDDSDANINPDATEIAYNGIDDDCNAMTLDDDLDQDGYLFADDCDDSDPNINLDATEIAYNGKDDDCNAMTLDDDLDQDGYLLADDCDDSDPNVNLDATEIAYNGKDDDCNAMTLDDDLDQDGYLLADDCDDSDPNINLDATEIAYNGKDDDCNATTLDDDLDQDGYLLADDCDDNDVNINPDATEIAYNGIDDDCNAMTLDDDLDQDGYLLVDDCDDSDPNINPDAIEIINNGIDEDCDGMDLVTSIYELANTKIKIYPNPASTVINIEAIGNLKFKTSLFDLYGNLIYSSTNTKQLLIKSIPEGTYYMVLKDINSEEKIVKRIVIVR